MVGWPGKKVDYDIPSKSLTPRLAALRGGLLTSELMDVGVSKYQPKKLCFKSETDKSPVPSLRKV